MPEPGQVMLGADGRLLLDDNGRIMIHDPNGEPCCFGAGEPCIHCIQPTPSRFQVTASSVQLCEPGVCFSLPYGRSGKLVENSGNPNGTYRLIQQTGDPGPCLWWWTNGASWQIRYQTWPNANCSGLPDADWLYLYASVMIAVWEYMGDTYGRLEVGCSMSPIGPGLPGGPWMLWFLSEFSLWDCHAPLELGNQLPACYPGGAFGGAGTGGIATTEER